MFEARDHTFAICAYKENPFLEDTVLSILAQNSLGKVLISTSTPNEHIMDIGKKHDIPVVVNPHPHLAGDDWNYAYNSTETALVTLAHQDDIYEKDYLSSILNVANSYPLDQLSILFTDYYEIRDEKNVSTNKLLFIKSCMNAPFKSRMLNGSIPVKKRILGFGDALCCPSVCYVKANLGASIFDTTYKNSCDYKTFVDLARKPGRFVYVPKKLLGHRIYAESATTLNLAENIRKREDEEILASLWPKPVAKAINKCYATSEKSNQLER